MTGDEILAETEGVLNKILNRSNVKIGQLGKYRQHSYDKFPDGSWNVVAGNDHIATFSMGQLPGCCGVCVSYRSWVSQGFRGKGLGTPLNTLRIKMAQNMGYGVLMCTDKVNNTPQRKILAKNGWVDIHTFNNPRTSNDIAITIYDLQKVR